MFFCLSQSGYIDGPVLNTFRTSLVVLPMVMEYMQYIFIVLGLALILTAVVLYLNDKVCDLQHIKGWWDVCFNLVWRGKWTPKSTFNIPSSSPHQNFLHDLSDFYQCFNVVQHLHDVFYRYPETRRNVIWHKRSASTFYTYIYIKQWEVIKLWFISAKIFRSFWRSKFLYFDYVRHYLSK